MSDGPVDLASYDRIITAFSGGKDSLACALHLLERGAPREKIELWHHDVDGREGPRMMDWPCTRDYCRKVAAALGLPLYFSWKVGGFEREMMRDGTPTAPTKFEIPPAHPVAVAGAYPVVDGAIQWDRGRVSAAVANDVREVGGGGPPGTRLLFPQVSPDLKVRWCSSYLKIDPAAAAIRNQERFNYSRTLFVTGERAEESTARAKYKDFEPHRSDARAGRKRRHVDQWRPVKGWPERQVWQIIERYRVNPHPAYRLGWGRVSCMHCIFGNDDQWASARAVDPEGFSSIARREAASGKTIKRRGSVVEAADRGTPYEMDPADVRAAMSETFDEPAILSEGAWRLPRGAFGDSCGPT